MLPTSGLATGHVDVSTGDCDTEADVIGRAVVGQCQDVVVAGTEVPVAGLADPGVGDVEFPVGAVEGVLDVVAGRVGNVAAVWAGDGDRELCVGSDVEV